MNARVLELLKNPKNIQSDDLSLLREEINSYPYIQNIRALHLYGVHLYDQDNYQKVLSTTAAYTTDKKILYQLINGKIQQEVKPIEVEKEEVGAKVDPEKISEVQAQPIEGSFAQEPIKLSSSLHNYEEITQDLIETKPEPKTIFVEGERNRILFEGEENFLNETNNNTIDLESTLESGSIIMQNNTIDNDTNAEVNSISLDENGVLQNVVEFDGNGCKIAEDIAVSTAIDAESKYASEEIIQVLEDKTPLPIVVFVEGERNRILFEGEENFLNETNNDTIDLESTLESGSIVIHHNDDVEQYVSINSDIKKGSQEGVCENSDSKIDDNVLARPFLEIGEERHTIEVKPEIENDSLPTLKVNSTEKTIAVESCAESIIEEDKITDEGIIAEVTDEAELSFHGTDSFLPNVKIDRTTFNEVSEGPQISNSINKHEDEMRRLIEEVEKKMKAKKEVEEKPLETQLEENSTDLNFSEIQSFKVKNEEMMVIEPQVVKEEPIIAEVDFTEEKEKSAEIVEEQLVSTWKPMSIDAHVPDSILSKKESKFTNARVQEIVEQKPTTIDTEDTSDMELISTEIKRNTIVANTEKLSNPTATILSKEMKIPSIIKEETLPTTTVAMVDDSNVPGFINTWQSWLKIDRTEEIEEDVLEKKNKVIESFIENSPKISQLKDEVNFVVKEKNDDISHLMTETLAKLYIEQKLYTKAIKAYQTLALKHPDRKAYFEGKVKEIKDNKSKN
ncbi:hypothetical protein [Chryseobacterium sp.]|uniref:hypothetical protein n=1 Tax=Chryseobacterium sp. TaxID=1871047 RepID=UPI00388F01CA